MASVVSSATLWTGMRRAVLVMTVGLLLVGALAPAIEALNGCVQPCQDDVDGRCTRDVCCSCCLHTGPAALGSAADAAPGLQSDHTIPGPAGRVLSADPRDLLHVPKHHLL